MIAYRFTEEEREGEGREEEETGQKEGRERGEHIREKRSGRGGKGGKTVERKEEGREKTQRNSTTFPCQKQSAQSSVVVSPPVWSPRQLSWILMCASHTTTHIHYK